MSWPSKVRIGSDTGERFGKTPVQPRGKPRRVRARRFELPVSELPRYGRLEAQVLPRLAVRRALEQEGCGHLCEPDRAAS